MTNWSCGSPANIAWCTSCSVTRHFCKSSTAQTVTMLAAEGLHWQWHALKEELLSEAETQTVKMHHLTVGPASFHPILHVALAVFSQHDCRLYPTLKSHTTKLQQQHTQPSHHYRNMSHTHTPTVRHDNTSITSQTSLMASVSMMEASTSLAEGNRYSGRSTRNHSCSLETKGQKHSVRFGA